jgi:diguanylate cyclase (GGDEF)-like protein/PAS domain S-box-containing protein
MVLNPFEQISRSSDAMLEEQYANLRAQIPLMYALMFVDAAFLGIATHGQVPALYSLAIPCVLCTIVALRSAVWLSRRGRSVAPRQIRHYLYGTVAGAGLVSAGFGVWGMLLLDDGDLMRSAAIALYVFVGAISACYCLQALPLAGWLVLLCGGLPVTARLVTSGDMVLTGLGVTFVLTGGVLLRILANSFAGLKELLHSRGEMGTLIAALQDSQEHYRHSVELSPQIPWIAAPDGLLTELGPRWSALTGLNMAQSLGTGWVAALHAEDLPRVRDLWERAVTTGQDEVADTRYRLRQKDGSYRWFRARAFPRRAASGTILSWYGSLEDIDEQVMAERALQESEERYRLASLASNDIILEVSLTQDRIDWGGAAATIFGYDVIANGASRRWWVERVHPRDRRRMLADFRRLRDPAMVHWEQEFRFRAADRSYLNLMARGHVVRDAVGQPLRMIGTLQDVTARKRYEDGLLRAAHYDSLTQLPNRVLFAERLEEALNAARRSERHVGLVVLDVDRFKTVNDSLGHDAGDVLLREIARRLTRRAPLSATVARLGGDEFAIILPDLESIEARGRIVERLLAQVAGPMFHDGRQIEVSLSAGSAVAFADGITSEDLHKSADLALYAAKSEGMGRLSYFRHDFRDAAAQRTQMLQNARQALKGDRIVPFYQPKVCLRTGACVGFEALLRWHDTQGLQAPAGISAAFDDPGLSVQLTDRMLDRVVADMVRWHDRGIPFHSIAVNGSAGDFMRGDFAERILERLLKAELPPSVIELEVTETVFLGQLAETVSAALTMLSSQGVQISLDDFGTGYASLTHLKQFPVDSIKIDRSFVSMLGAAETEDDAIVGAVIDLAGNLDIRTVAEGIETSAQLAHLVVKGCDVGQGYLFGRPMAGAQVAEVIAAWDDEAVASLWASADWESELRRMHQGRFPLGR